ncbi:ATP-binding protein [Mycobacterium sp. SM1]|nr:ATP-binding protein [Mycobacterium sp. SM1]
MELLIIDDWFLTTPSRQQIQQLHTLIDRRHKTASTIYCTQLPPGQWHDRMEEKILASENIEPGRDAVTSCTRGSTRSKGVGATRIRRRCGVCLMTVTR